MQGGRDGAHWGALRVSGFVLTPVPGAMVWVLCGGGRRQVVGGRVASLGGVVRGHHFRVVRRVSLVPRDRRLRGSRRAPPGARTRTRGEVSVWYAVTGLVCRNGPLLARWRGAVLLSAGH